MKSFNKYLQQFPHYTPDVFESVKPFLFQKTLEPGAFFLRIHQICRNIAFVKEGMLRLYYLNEGKEVTNCFCRENVLTTSYRSLVSHQESDIAIQAIEETKLIVLPYEALQMLYEKNLFWQQVGRLAVGNELITSECHNRFIKDLSATERYQQIMETDNELLQRVPLTYLATYLQIAPETLSRIRNKISQT